jgi:hypothetical protein
MALRTAPKIAVTPSNAPAGQPFLAGWRRDAVVCLSLVNLCFIPVWGQVLSLSKPGEWLKTIPAPADIAAAMTAVLLLAALLYGAVRLARRQLGDRGLRVARFAWFALAAIPLNGQRENVKPLLAHLKSVLRGWMGPRTALFLVALACAAMLWLVWKYQGRIAAAASAILVVLSPFCLMTFGQAVWAMVTYSGQPYRDGPLAPRLATAPPPVRVVWIVFDEWDYRLTFVDRPASLAMPEIDRLRGESLFATAARSPAMTTQQSLPSLISGRRVASTGNDYGFRLLVTPMDHPEAKAVPWEEIPSIFSVVRRAGFNAGLVGWYLPYCRTMNGVLSECAWCVYPTQSTSAGDSFLAGLLGSGFWGEAGGYAVGLLETGVLSPFGRSSTVRQKARQYLDLLAESKKNVTDSTLGLVFLHIPVPHAPHPYDRFTGRLDAANRPVSGYIDSLALLDRMMGELRAAMESRGTWDHTVLLMSADHPDRASAQLDGKSDWRVPFLLRFPGRPAAGAVTPEFSTILSANLVYAILRGSVSTAAQASEWIERRQADRESPVGAAD